jgi:hypothetical protein
MVAVPAVVPMPVVAVVPVMYGLEELQQLIV